MHRRLSLLVLSLQLFVQGPTWALDVRDSDAIRALRATAIELQLHGDGDGALEKYKQAIDLASRAYGSNSPFVGELYYDMGVIAFNFHKFEPAEDYLRDSLRLNPTMTSAKLQLAEVLQQRQKPEESLRIAQSVLAKQRGNSQARYLVATAYKNMGNNARSLQEFYGLATGAQTLPTIAKPAPVEKPAAIDKPVDKPKTEKPKAEKPKTEKPKAEKPKAEKPKPEAKVQKPKPQPEKVKPPKQEKPKPKPKPKPATPAKPQVQPVVPRATLEADAKLLTNIKKKPETAKPKVETTDKGDQTPTSQPVEKPKPAEKPKPVKKPPAGFVPPPPPMPVIGFPPPQQQPAKKVEVKPAEKPVEKPKPKPVVVEKDEDPGEGDPSFLLDWAGTKSKKKK